MRRCAGQAHHDGGPDGECGTTFVGIIACEGFHGVMAETTSGCFRLGAFWSSRAGMTFADPVFREGKVAMNFEDTIHVSSPERHYDAAVLLPLNPPDPVTANRACGPIPSLPARRSEC